ncbi:conserved hypothetical protein [Desulfamplus magnetovallimortis]|uniref:Uncharacterized protein n=1 Tax=Desulfamplus magnetovallimortis TaxID=1246637 RepID=A0A1W1HKJ2_9BACT|nr:hypothetical protein [Desulfamplus magnetovallimortis]SLM32935.1 conserved hypothetical protein [Desulfamplus magnetovallimortis]
MKKIATLNSNEVSSFPPSCFDIENTEVLQKRDEVLQKRDEVLQKRESSLLQTAGLPIMGRSKVEREDRFLSGTPLYFNINELKILDEAVLIAEELVNDYYKISSTLWLSSRYDIKTAKDLQEHEIVYGPFAQVLGYRGRESKGGIAKVIDYYKVCFQDHAILTLPELHWPEKGSNLSVSQVSDLHLTFLPFLIYITVHELVHIVRFATFKQIYAMASEADCAMEEERKVHAICLEILKKISVSGMENVLLFFNKWIVKSDSY